MNAWTSGCGLGAWCLGLALSACFTPIGAIAADYKSIDSEAAVLYDAPTLRGRKVALAPRGMPVDPVVAEGDWVRVRDMTGSFFWVEKRQLSDKRMVIANIPAGNVATVRADADDNAAVVFQIQPGVLLEWLDSGRGGWVHVRHRDGQTGYVKAAEVWGE